MPLLFFIEKRIKIDYSNDIVDLYAALYNASVLRQERIIGFT